MKKRYEVGKNELSQLSFDDTIVTYFMLDQKENKLTIRCTDGQIGDVVNNFDIEDIEIIINKYISLHIIQSSGKGWNPKTIETPTVSDYLEDICEFIVETENEKVRFHGFSKNGWTEYHLEGGSMNIFYSKAG